MKLVVLFEVEWIHYVKVELQFTCEHAPVVDKSTIFLAVLC